MELCRDKQVRHKLRDKSAIQGAINTSWIIHKTDLLKLEVDKMEDSISQVYKDKTVGEDMLSTIKNKKMAEITDT